MDTRSTRYEYFIRNAIIHGDCSASYCVMESGEYDRSVRNAELDAIYLCGSDQYDTYYHYNFIESRD